MSKGTSTVLGRMAWPPTWATTTLGAACPWPVLARPVLGRRAWRARIVTSPPNLPYGWLRHGVRQPETMLSHRHRHRVGQARKDSAAGKDDTTGHIHYNCANVCDERGKRERTKEEGRRTGVNGASGSRKSRAAKAGPLHIGAGTKATSRPRSAVPRRAALRRTTPARQTHEMGRRKELDECTEMVVQGCRIRRALRFQAQLCML